MSTINITVKNKIATAPDDIIVCGNSDYIIHFDFDNEWAAYTTKTARFIFNGSYTDVVFTGTNCNMPVITNSLYVAIGVYSGNLHTTTPAILTAKKSILCENPTHFTPTPDVYNQIIALLNGFSASVSKSGNKSTITITDPQGTTTAEVLDGAKGDKGDTGEGIPTGGSTGQVLAKKSATDFETEWVNQGSGGTADFDELTNRPKYNDSAMTHETNIPEVKSATWNAKQEALVSGTNIKTINNQSILGSGNIDIQGIGVYEIGDNAPPYIKYTATEIKNLAEAGNILTYGGSMLRYLGYNGNTKEVELRGIIANWNVEYLDVYINESKVPRIAERVEFPKVVYTPITDSTARNVHDFYAQFVDQDVLWICRESAEGWSSTNFYKHHFVQLIGVDNTTNPTYCDGIYFDSNALKTYKLRVTANGITRTEMSTVETTSGSQSKVVAHNSDNNAHSSLLSAKQDTLISGTNIKTINNQSLLGGGDITIQGSNAQWGSITGTLANQTDLNTALGNKVDKETGKGLFSGSYNDLTDKPTIPTKTSDITNDSGFITNSYHDSTKQDTLVSGTNIKTINSQSLLGGGDITISGGSENWELINTVTATEDVQNILINQDANNNGFELKKIFLVVTTEASTGATRTRYGMRVYTGLYSTRKTVSSTDLILTKQEVFVGGTETSLLQINLESYVRVGSTVYAGMTAIGGLITTVYNPKIAREYGARLVLNGITFVELEAVNASSIFGVGSEIKLYGVRV